MKVIGSDISISYSECLSMAAFDVSFTTVNCERGILSFSRAKSEMIMLTFTSIL